MPRRSPRSIAALQDAIVNAALDLGGDLDAVSMPDLAGKAGVAVGTLYRVAPGKVELRAMVALAAQVRFETVVFAPFPVRLTLQDRFNLIFDRLAGFATADPQAAHFMARQAHGPDSAYGRASVGFARDGAAAGMFPDWTGADVIALTWGPVAALILAERFDPQAAARLKPALWRALTSL
jgi:AcrR family transcriptional regulator